MKCYTYKHWAHCACRGLKTVWSFTFVHLLPTREYEGRTIGMLLHTDFRAVLTGTSLLQCLGHMGAWGLLG